MYLWNAKECNCWRGENQNGFSSIYDMPFDVEGIRYGSIDDGRNVKEVYSSWLQGRKLLNLS
jgi:hypothetical protein